MKISGNESNDSLTACMHIQGKQISITSYTSRLVSSSFLFLKVVFSFLNTDHKPSQATFPTLTYYPKVIYYKGLDFSLLRPVIW